MAMDLSGTHPRSGQFVIPSLRGISASLDTAQPVHPVPFTEYRYAGDVSLALDMTDWVSRRTQILSSDVSFRTIDLMQGILTSSSAATAPCGH